LSAPLALHGIVPSLNTPFCADDSLDLAGIERLIGYCAEAGCGGLLILAVAGETASLTARERQALLETVMASNAGRLPVVVGVSAAGIDASVAYARRAADAGAFAVLWQPPAGLGLAGIERGMHMIGAQAPKVMLQDLDWQGDGLPVEAIAGLFDRVPAFGAIKIETVRAGPKYSAVLEATRGRLHVSGGWAVTQMIEALERGVHAFMPTGMERIYCAIHRAYARGQADRARALFEQALPALVFANQHIDVSIRFFKHLRRVGGLFETERCRPPVAALDPFQQRNAERLAHQAQALEQSLQVA
jgi:dihydrodipicolinate synthase/N-acetylneuraminate lyase